MPPRAPRVGSARRAIVRRRRQGTPGDDEPVDRQRAVMEVWNWLPAFRAVAEVEHVHRAAARLHVSPSALSRMIKLLEESLGGQLFERAGRGIRLTDRGRDVLDAARTAMRIVHDVLERPSRLRVSSAGSLAMAYLSPALARLRREHEGLVVNVVASPEADVLSLLLRGELDLALMLRPVTHPHLDVALLGEASSGVYCGKSHPLFSRRKVRVEDILRHPFAGPASIAGRVSVDGWPPELPRSVVLQTSILEGALESCANGELLAVFPDDLVGTFYRGERLRRLDCEVILPARVYSITRSAAGNTHGLVQALVAELAREFASR